MVRGSLLSHLSMPVNSGAVLRVLTGLATGLAAALAAGLATRLPIAAALLATAAANRATIAAVLSRESMSESFQGGEQSGDPGVHQDVVLQIDRESGEHHQHAEHLLQAVCMACHQPHAMGHVLTPVNDGEHWNRGAHRIQAEQQG